MSLLYFAIGVNGLIMNRHKRELDSLDNNSETAVTVQPDCNIDYYENGDYNETYASSSSAPKEPPPPPPTPKAQPPSTEESSTTEEPTTSTIVPSTSLPTTTTPVATTTVTQKPTTHKAHKTTKKAKKYNFPHANKDDNIGGMPKVVMRMLIPYDSSSK
ncbi:hypothetical protein ACQ4LE_005084 [Meloidogyne hapla]|uniref:Extensin-like n=1 Tax=Meloidogyne hapla TaxID=6305 RepID=A0A1I8BCF6_MELHA